jgi:hypothetical protein
VVNTERWRDLKHSGKLKLAGFTFVVLYAMPWLVYGVGATQRGHQEDNGVWLIAFAAALVATAFLGLRRPVLAGSILVLPSVGLGLLLHAYDPGMWAVTLLVVGPPFAGGLLLLVAGFRERWWTTREKSERT